MMERREFLKLSFTGLAATTLLAVNLEWIFDQAKDPDIIGNSDFEKYILSELNKLPARQVGRIVKIETIHQETSFNPLMQGLSVNKHYNGGKYWAFSYNPELFADMDNRKLFVKDMAIQLEIAFKQ